MSVGNRRHIPVPIKEQMVNLSQKNWRAEDIAEALSVHVRTVRRVVRLAEQTGSVVRVPLHNGRPRALDGLDMAFLESCIERRPDSLPSELRDELWKDREIRISEATITRSLERRGFMRKKVTHAALDGSEKARIRYQKRVKEHYRPEQLVFVDESAFNRIVTGRNMAWTPMGNRARRRDYYVQGKRYSILPALSLDGVLHLDVQECAYNTQLFTEFVDGLLDKMNPFPEPKSVIVMDHASMHKSADLRALVEARGMRLEFLPPYSPDLNPIEEAFTAVKAWLRANPDIVRAEETGELDRDPYAILREAVSSTATPEKALEWFRHSGYL